jgi:hypothetical protein
MKYLIEELLKYIDKPRYIVIHGYQEVAVVLEEEFYRDIIPMLYDFCRTSVTDDRHPIFGLWFDELLGNRRFSPYYADFCPTNLSDVCIVAIIYFNTLRRVLTFMVTGSNDLEQLQQRGIDYYLKSKIPFVGRDYLPWLLHHHPVYPDGSLL